MAGRQDFIDMENEFNAAWGTNITLYEIDPKKLKAVQLDAFKKEKKNAASLNYLKLVQKILYTYMDTHSLINPTNTYNKMQNFSADAFLGAVEDLLNMKFESEKTGDSTRKPYEGIDRAKLVQHIDALAKPYNKTLTDVWTDKVKSGDMDVEKMQQITDKAETLLMVKSSHSGIMTADKKVALQNVVAAHDALEAVRKGRGRLWAIAPWHWKRNSQEKQYLNKLKGQVTALEKAEYPVSAARASANQKLMEEPKADGALTLDAVPEIAPNAGIDNVVKNLNPIIEDKKKVAEFSEKLFAAIPNGKEMIKGREEKFSGGLWATLTIVFQNGYNQKYDEHQATKRDPEIPVKSLAGITFSEAFLGLAEQIGYTTVREKLVAAQIMMDMIMKEYTAARFQPEKYAKYASGYALNNPADIKDFKNIDKKEIEAAKAEYIKIVGSVSKDSKVEEAVVNNGEKKEEKVMEDRSKLPGIDLNEKHVEEKSDFVKAPDPQEVKIEKN